MEMCIGSLSVDAFIYSASSPENLHFVIQRLLLSLCLSDAQHLH